MTRWRSEILGSQIDAVTAPEAADILESFLASGQHHVVTPNPEFVLEARRCPEFQRIINQSDLAIPDGFGLVIASRFTPVKIERRIAGSDLVHQMLKLASKRGLKVAVVNYADSLSTTSEIEQILPRQFPGLRIKVFELGPRGSEAPIPLGPVRAFQPVLLLAALGAPQQDLWIKHHLKDLPSVHLAMGVGGSLDFLTGKRKRGPRWMQRTGLEWLYRLFSKPTGGDYHFGRRLKKIFRSVIIFPLVFVFTANQK